MFEFDGKRDGCIGRARRRENEDRSARERNGLRTEGLADSFAEEALEGGFAVEADCAGLELLDQRNEAFPSTLKFAPTEIARAARWPLHDIGQSIAELGHAKILIGRKEPRREACFVKEPPERVSRVGVVMACGGGDEPGIDPDKEELQSRGEIVRQGTALSWLFRRGRGFCKSCLTGSHLLTDLEALFFLLLDDLLPILHVPFHLAEEAVQNVDVSFFQSRPSEKPA